MRYEVHTQDLTAAKETFAALSDACDAADAHDPKRAWVIAAWLPRTDPQRIVYQNPAEKEALERLLRESRRPPNRTTTPPPPEHDDLIKQTKTPVPDEPKVTPLLPPKSE